MSSCTFFGHSDCPDSIKSKLRKVLVELITKYSVDMFYVGNQGKFDALVRSTLQELIKEYPWINYAVVLAYVPQKRTEYEDYSDTMIPEGIEHVHPHYAISWRNRWMINQSEYVVAYVVRSWGGAAQYTKKAKKAGKTIFNTGNYEEW